VASPRTNIAVLSTSCRFPDAASPAELWANVLEGRRSFRAIPPQRLEMARYAAEAVGEADSITHIRAGLLTNWNFDRSRFRIPEKTFAAADLTHWLALELAAESIGGIGGPDRLDRLRTAVVVANTMTGEFSRAALLRLRLPFLEAVLDKASDAEGFPSETATRLRHRFAAGLRSHFPDPNEDSLAGGLANTIAGRIANHFDLRGGAYSVDGACASSLVALADAANLLVSGQVDAVVVAAVDLSLDPFELVGFSRNGALAADEMRVFDARAGGFWPGEGGACAVLMREKDALHRQLPVLARILGWGLSTDGAGGLTRPSSEGQLASYRRAYEMAGVDPADLAFVEAHGTGTAVGDPIEVRALAALRDNAPSALPIGSIKANIGHTKAAAGFAGLIKAIEALRHGMVPPHIGCLTPHPVFAEVGNSIRPALTWEPIDGRPAVAGVSSFGFGGINAHVVIERTAAAAPLITLPRPPVTQDAELFLFSGDRTNEIMAHVVELERRAPALSMAEFTDAAAHAAATLRYGSIRVAVVASSGVELADRLSQAKQAMLSGDKPPAGPADVVIGRPNGRPRIGFIFPGQAAPVRPDGGIWRRRFSDTADLIARIRFCSGADTTATDVAQPAIVASSLAALCVLDRLGVTADIVSGHSLGEITALSWAGALDHAAAIDLARARGSIMARFGLSGGAMLRVALSADDAERLFNDGETVVACRNGRFDTVIAGSTGAVAAAAGRCAARNIETSQLAVSHAFHSADMEAAVIPLATALEAFRLQPIAAPVISTITGAPLAQDSVLRNLLVDQLTKPVLFDRALEELAKKSDILIEVGPGHGLTRLAQDWGLTAMSVDAMGETLKPLLATLGALFVAGVDIRANALFEDRNIRSFDAAAAPSFIESPCGSRSATKRVERRITAAPVIEAIAFDRPAQGEPLAVVLSVIAAETGLDISRFGADDRFLDAFHLNSLAVSRIVRAAAKALNARVPAVPTEFANATPRLLADTLAELREFGGNAAGARQRIAGIRPWVRTYGMQWQAAREPKASRNPCRWSRAMIGQEAPSALEGDFNSGLLISISGPFGMESAERLVVLATRAAKAGVEHLALCHSGLPVAAFARSVAGEGHFRSVRVIDRGSAGVDDPRLDQALSADLESYDEIRLAENGGFETPAFVPSSIASSSLAAITADDVVVIVGGGKGIAAECALRAANRGSAVILVGRSAADDPDVAATLDRASRKGLRCRYVSANVLDHAALLDGLEPVTREFGLATVLVYAPGVNEPKRLTELDAETIRKTLAPKTTGLESALQTLGPQLRRLVTFGSLIGRIGLEGEAHYALANAMQTAATEAWAAASPHRTALAIEWSLWGGTGMGERLGTIERLSTLGVDALSADDALEAFDKLFAENAAGAVVVTSRFGPPPALSLGAMELPMLRFVDETKVHFPGVELIVETTLSQGRDAYLGDHAIDGVAVLPGVMGLEAMAQVASALMPLGDHISATGVAFARAIQVAADAQVRVRIAGLRTDPSDVVVALFAEDDDFAVPCMQATFHAEMIDQAPIEPPRFCERFPAAPLYGPLFFGGSRFQRLGHFETATSRQVSARLRRDDGTRWFGSYEPEQLILWDPGAADAALHALQIAVPHKRVLPVSAERIDIDRSAGVPMHVCAIEKKALAGTYIFDITATDSSGRTAYRWTNVAFRAVGRIDMASVLVAAPPLGRPYLERVAREALGDDTIEVVLIHDRDGSRESRRIMALRTFDLDGMVERRADGRPIRSDGNGSISLSHSDTITLAVTASSPIGCDIEMTNAADAGDLDELHRHVAFEVCRKLGRKPTGALRSPPPGAVTAIADIDLVAIDLPTPSGSHTVAFGRVRRPGKAALQPSSFSISEAVP
jgi:enediyne polyketide synthase